MNHVSPSKCYAIVIDYEKSNFLANVKTHTLKVLHSSKTEFIFYGYYQLCCQKSSYCFSSLGSHSWNPILTQEFLPGKLHVSLLCIPTWSHFHVYSRINSSLLSYLWMSLLLIWSGEGRVMCKRGEPNIYCAISMFQALC